MDNAAIVTALLLRAIAMTQQYATLLHNSRAEDRDISDEEIAALKSGYASERAAAMADIEASR